MNEKYLKYGLYAVGGVFVLLVVYFVYQLFVRARSGAQNSADVAADKAEDLAISKSFGLNEYDTNNARTTAKKIAVELETDKDLTYWAKVTHFVDKEKIAGLLRKVKSGKEMRLVSHFYKNNYTNTNNLKADLKAELSSATFNGLPFVEFLTD